MPNKQFMSNEKILKAVGVSDEMIAQIKTADSTTAVNTLDAIFNTIMSYISKTRIEIANLRNPLKIFEKGYAELNGGELNGMFREILVPLRDKGNNALYGGKKYQPKTITNPWASQDYGKDPIQFVYGVNAKIERVLDYNRDDFLMALNNEALGDFIAGKLATLEGENDGSRYVIENNVLNCEAFQYKDYANATFFSSPDELNAFMHKVYKMQSFPESNTEYKRMPFNSTRKNMNLVFVFDSEFAFDFAQKYQFKQYLKPFMYRSEDADEYGTQTEKSSFVEVDKLTPTTLAQNTVLDPLNMTPTALSDGKKLVGRIIDFNAVKFGVGKKSAVSFPLDARTMHYNEISDYCFNMCPAYVNVPIIIDSTFKSDRIIHTVS